MKMDMKFTKEEYAKLTAAQEKTQICSAQGLPPCAPGKLDFTSATVHWLILLLDVSF
jgi:hypothetical protein